MLKQSRLTSPVPPFRRAAPLLLAALFANAVGGVTVRNASPVRGELRAGIVDAENPPSTIRIACTLTAFSGRHHPNPGRRGTLEDTNLDKGCRIRRSFAPRRAKLHARELQRTGGKASALRGMMHRSRRAGFMTALLNLRTDGGTERSGAGRGDAQAGAQGGLAAVTTPTVPTTASPGPGFSPMRGFTAEEADRERILENRFDSELRREDFRTWMRRLTAHPHHLGSRYDRENAEWIAAQFRSWGFDASIEQFDVLFSTPRTRALEMRAPVRFSASLRERPLREDPASSVQGQLPPYNAYSADGDVTGELVYVNYGVPQDYETLAERGVDVKGKIVISRYGGCWRGIKPKVAAEKGAVGCILYSDPRDDGYYRGDVYPKGAFRNDSGVQRGSVADIPLFPGDPLTPGIGAVKGAKRLALKDAPTITRIPVLPISYGDAGPLLRNLGGEVAPEEWRGALPFTYHLGPGPSVVHLKVKSNWNIVPCYDVIARIKGAERPEEWVMRGNHHDAWVLGAEDPVSGTVALMAEARAVARLAREGWRPRRTMIYAVWDGEEPGLLGSTEWVETHAEVLGRSAAMYVNSDGNRRGFLHVQGSHSLEQLVNEVARDVKDPERNISVLERLRDYTAVNGPPDARKGPQGPPEMSISAPGSGSDYTPFIQHLGIASLNIGYSGESSGGSYHSLYDSFKHFSRFIDPGFRYDVVLAKTAGRVMLRAANAPVLPFEFHRLAETVARYVAEVVVLADQSREETLERNRQIREHVLENAADPSHPFVLPAPKEVPPKLSFAPLQNAAARLQAASERFEEAAAASQDRLDSAEQAAVDQVMIQTERSLIGPKGLPRRPWYRHLLYAPGFYTGYGVKTLPGVREAIEERKWSEAAEQTDEAAKAIDRLSDLLDRGTRLMTAAGTPLGVKRASSTPAL